MRIKFSLYHDENRTTHECNLVDFALRLPNLLSKRNKLIPPSQVLLDTFEKGVLVAGADGLFEWSGFSLLETELNELAIQLQNRGFIIADAPSWVINREAWIIWKFEYLNQIPSKKHLSLYNQLYTVEQAMEAAMGDNQTTVLNKLAQEKNQLMSKLSDCLEDFIS